MKKSLRLLLTAVFLLAIHPIANAQEIDPQEDPRPYNSVADTVAKAITAELPGWRRKSVPPLNTPGRDDFSYEVIIDQWSSGEGSVRVVIFLHPSDAVAKDEFGKFTAGIKANEPLPDVDTEAHAWGMNKSVALRTGRYAVYISSVVLSVADEEGVPDKRSKEEARLSKTFAKIVARALKGMQ
jgi:hypothetical protein